MNHRYSRLELIRQFIATNFTAVLVLLFFLAAVGAGLAYLTHVDSDVEYEEKTVATATITSEYDYNATVQEENPVYPIGTELTDRTHFFSTITPVLDGQYTFSYATTDGELESTTEMVLVLENTADDEVVWSDEDQLDASASNNGQTSTSFSLNMTTLDSRIEEIEQDLGTSPRRIDIMIVARTTMNGELEGEEVSETYIHELIITPQDETYRVVSGSEPDPAFEVTESQQVESSSGVLSPFAPILLLLSSVVALVGLILAKQVGRLEVHPDSTQALEFEKHRQAHDDWISRGTIREHQREASVELQTLEELVDTAIDTDSRVIEDQDDGNYYVLDGDVLYVFSPSDHEIDDIL